MAKILFIILSCVAGFKFLVFSDLHYSPYSSCKGISSIWCDTSEELLKSALNAMSSISPSFDLLISLGDELAHGQKSSFTVKSLISHLFEEYSSSFPNTKKLHTIGNNEGFYSSQTPREYLDHLAFLYQFWIPSAWRNYEFLQFGYYSLSIENIKFIVLHSSLLQFDGLAATEQLIWLENELDKSKNATVVILTHSPPVNSMFNTGERLWTEKNSYFFREIVGKYSASVSAILAGHLHRGIFSCVSEVPVIINPSISPIYNTVPSFRVYEMINGNLDFEEYTLNGDSWEKSYKFSEQFVPISKIPTFIADLDPDSPVLDAIIKLSRGYNLDSDIPIEQIYQISTNSTIDLEKQKKVVWCSLQDLTFEEFTKCKE